MAFMFFSCKKSENNSEIKDNQKNDFEIIFNPNPFNIKNENNEKNDIQENVINQKLINLAFQCKILFKNGDYNTFLLNTAKNRRTFSVSFQEFIQNFENSASIDRKNIFDSLKLILGNNLLVRNSEEGLSESYIPGMFIPNVLTAEANQKPIISFSEEVDTDKIGYENYEGYIIGWYMNENGNFDEILINEEMAMNTKHPLIIVDNIELGFLEKPITNAEKPGNPSPTTKSTDEDYPEIVSYEHYIKKRFDHTPKSEFCIAAGGVFNNGTVAATPLTKPNSTTTQWLLINDIHKNSVGNQIDQWRDLFRSDNGVKLNTPGLKMIWNTFERDWYSSNKSLGKNTFYQVTIELAGNRKWLGDYYMYDPNINGGLPEMDINYILSTWAKKYENNDRSMIRFWKVIQ